MAEAEMVLDFIPPEQNDPAEVKTTPPGRPGGVTVDHLVDCCHHYPGEAVTFYTRLCLRETLPELRLRISIPPGLELHDYRFLSPGPQDMPATEVTEETTYLVWSLAGPLPAGTEYEYETVTRAAPVKLNTEYDSAAQVSTGDGSILVEEVVTVIIISKGSYLKYLPSFYEQDDLMGNLVMLFESFWAPIEAQIDQEHHYFDPRLTTLNFLPWLASWLDLKLDERWPEARQRQLIRWAIALHRSRGTRWGLQKYLEIYTGQQAEITEHQAKNLMIGPDARLGPSIALGENNFPHTFAVTLPLPTREDESEAERQLRRHTIISIIERQKPAHTRYVLDLVPLAVGEGEAEAQAGAAEAKVDEVAARAALWFKLDE